MAPKLRHKLPKEQGWEHLQPCRVARREQGHEVGRPGRVRTHLRSRPSKRTGTLSSPWTTTHYHSTSRSMVPSTSMNSARKRQGQVRRFLLICCGKACTPSSSRRPQGPAGGSGETSEPVTRSRSPTPSLSSLPEDAPHAKILRLLRVLHRLNVVEAERQHHPSRSLPESAFVNNKLSAKLTRQLEEPMIVAR
jgi:hypothetical protein